MSAVNVRFVVLWAIAMWPMWLPAQDPCCHFSDDIAAGWQVSFPDPSNPCLVQVCAPQFFDDDCVESIPYQDIMWGDASVALPAFSPLQACYVHEYASGGTYVVGSTIYRMDPTGAVCGIDSMFTTIEVNCPQEDTCCEDFADFENKLAQGWIVQTDGCTVTVCAPQFEGDCYYLATSDLSWGDGNAVIPGLTPFESCYTHAYMGSGTYVISGNICEVGSDGEACWCKEMEVTVSVDCGPPPADSCCVDYGDFLDKIAQGWQVYVNGCDVTICAPQFDSACHVLTWSGPDWGDGTPRLPVISPIQPCYTHTYASSGTYDITATICEQSNDGCLCWCEQMNVAVEVQCVPTDCCADSLAFYDRVAAGFDVSQGQCCIDLTPAALGECDVIMEWCVDGFCLPGPYPPDATFTYCFNESGPHEVCMHVAMIDSLTGAICADTVFCDTIWVDCNTGCPCGPWDLTAILHDDVADKDLDIALSCGDTLGFGCGWQSLTFSGGFSCQTNPTYACMPKLLFFQMEDPLGSVIVGTLTGSSLHLTFTESLFAVAGVYKLTLVGDCGGNKCVCTIYIDRPQCGGNGCCSSFDDFNDRVQAGFSWSYDGCCVTVVPDSLSVCDQVVSWCWGDSTCADGPFDGTAPLTHCYAQSGAYEVCMTVVEMDTLTGAPCWEATYCEWVQVGCPSACTCQWDMQLTNGGLSWSPSCDDTLTLDCPYGDLSLTALLHCIMDPPTPNCAPWEEINWYLDRPDPLTDLSGSALAPMLNLSLSTTELSVPGLYELRLESGCYGGDTCSCSIYFSVPNCPPVSADEPQWLREIQLLPNPTSDQVLLVLPQTAQWGGQGWTLRLWAPSGQQLSEETIQSGMRQLSFELRDMPAGTYQLVLYDTSGQVRWAQAFVKMDE